MGPYGVLGLKKMIFEIFDFFRSFDEILEAQNSAFLECPNGFFWQKIMFFGCRKRMKKMIFKKFVEIN